MKKNSFPFLVLIIFMTLNLSNKSILALEKKPYINRGLLSGYVALEKKPYVNRGLLSGYVETAQDVGYSSITEVSPIEKFVSAFTKEVNSSKVLTDLFNLTETTPSAFCRFLYDYVMTILVQYKIPEPQKITDSLTQPIADNVEAFTLPLVVKTYANSMAKFLLDEGVLNTSNANSLASRYAKEMQKSAKPREAARNLESLPDGYISFLKSLDLFIPEKFADIASGFGNEVKLQFGK